MKHKSSRWSAVPLVLGLVVGMVLGPEGLRAQQSAPPTPTSIDYSRSSSFPNIFAPYTSPLVPESRMSNSERLHMLVRDGKLMLSVEDAIALALENNLDIAVARYGPAFAQTDILRAKSGGATRGVSGAFTSQALFAGAIGGGVSGFSGGGTGGAGGITGGGGAVNIGAVGCCDPSAGFTFGWDRRTSPLNFVVVSGIPVVTTQTTSMSTFYGQGFMTGTSYIMSFSGDRQSTTSLNTLFNPVVPAGMTLGFNQHLLNGFGYRANARFLRLSKTNARIADTVFREQVIITISQILNLYWDLVVFRENVRVAEKSLALAEKTLADNKRQVEIGTLAPIEVVRAESEEAARQEDLIVAQTKLQQQQELLKTAISKQVDKDLAGAQIEPTDSLPGPKPGDVPPLDEALREAAKNRPEIEQAELNLENQSVVIQANRNSLLPTLDVFATYAPTGLSGNSCPPPSFRVAGGCKIAGQPGILPVQGNGFSQSLSQVFRGNFPDYSFGMTLRIPLRNRSAQADAARALLEERQLRVQMQKTKNQIEQDVRNAEIAITQAKAQIAAASKAVTLSQQTLDAEQKKFQLGESTVFLVIQAQRDLAAAEVREVQARSAYAKALTQFSQATGTTLAKNNIELNEAKEGRVSRNPNIPGTPVAPPASQGLGGGPAGS